MMFEQRLNPWSRLALLIGLCGAGIILSSVLSAIVGNLVLHVPLITLVDALMKPENIGVNRLLQVFTTFLVMAVPAFLVTYFSGGDTMTKLGFRQKTAIAQLGLVVLMVFFGFMLSDTLSILNKMIPLSESAARTFKQMEDDYSNQVMSIASMKSFSDYFLSLVILAGLPALFEEMLFRGTLQPIMISIARKPLYGILITSALFSAIHISFYGFLPRLFLGLMLGYVFYLSKSLWLSIAAHFLNNAYTLTVIYIYSLDGKSPSDAFDESFPWYYGIVGAVSIIFLFLIFKKESDKIPHPPATEQDDQYEGLV